jgi:hypothetical protein
MVAALLLVGGGARAEERQSPLSARPLESTVAPTTAPLTEKEAKALLRAKIAAATDALIVQELLRPSVRTQTVSPGEPGWNCGMPIVAPSASPDPGIARPADPTPRPDVQFHITRVAPRRCGR